MKFLVILQIGESLSGPHQTRRKFIKPFEQLGIAETAIGENLSRTAYGDLFGDHPTMAPADDLPEFVKRVAVLLPAKHADTSDNLPFEVLYFK